MKCVAILIFIIASGAGEPDDDYIAGYKYFKDLNAYAKINRTKVTWEEARAQCVREGALLWVPRSISEGVRLNTYFSGEDWIWVGFHDLYKEGQWMSIEGEEQAEIYNNWMKNEPNGERSENCGLIYKTGSLLDHTCSSKMPFICKASKENPFEGLVTSILPEIEKLFVQHLDHRQNTHNGNSYTSQCLENTNIIEKVTQIEWSLSENHKYLINKLLELERKIITYSISSSDTVSNKITQELNKIKSQKEISANALNRKISDLQLSLEQSNLFITNKIQQFQDFTNEKYRNITRDFINAQSRQFENTTKGDRNINGTKDGLDMRLTDIQSLTSKLSQIETDVTEQKRKYSLLEEESTKLKEELEQKMKEFEKS